jgi:hypothetical protein
VKDDRQAWSQLAAEERKRTERIAQLESEMASLRRTLGDCEEQLRAVMSPDSATHGNVLDALQAAKQRFNNELVLHAKAVQSARVSPYRHPAKVYYALSVLAQYVRERLQLPGNKHQLRPNLEAWLKEKNCPFEYASGESESTLNDPDARKARTIEFGGLSCALKKHLKLGGGRDPQFCCRIYFETLTSGDNRILIGHVGIHPPTA